MAREDYNIGAPIYPTWRVNWRICSLPEIRINTCFNDFQCNLYASESVGKISNYSIYIFYNFYSCTFYFQLALSNRCANFAASPNISCFFFVPLICFDRFRLMSEPQGLNSCYILELNITLPSSIHPSMFKSRGFIRTGQSENSISSVKCKNSSFSRAIL